MSGFFGIVNSIRERRRNYKVILATNYYYPQLGGITISVDNLYKNLLKGDVDAEVFAYPHLLRRIENRTGRLGALYLHKLFVVGYIVFGLIKVLFQRLGFKKVIVHGHSANFCALFSYLSRYLGAKAVFTFHTDVRLRELEMQTKTLKRKVSYLNKIDKLTAVSAFLARQVKDYYSIDKKVEVIYNTVSYSTALPHRKEGGILFVGNLSKIKDPETFLHAIKLLHEQGITPKVSIVGIGPLEPMLKEFAYSNNLKNVRFFGLIDHRKLQSYYLKSSLLVVSSIGEGLPNTILEAISCNTKVVATQVGGIPEIEIEKNNYGKLVPVKDPKNLAQAIKETLFSKDERNPASILEKFNWERQMRKFIQLYNSLYLNNTLQREIA
jgi:glycosyltransferase involved in cell wall biosynthesis